MWFFIAEGYHYTHNIKKYLLRLGIFAVISHFAYCFAFGINFIPFKTGVFNQTSIICYSDSKGISFNVDPTDNWANGDSEVNESMSTQVVNAIAEANQTAIEEQSSIEEIEEMPNLVNEKLDVAKKTLIGLGMDNFEINNSTDYTNANMLIVTSQSIAAKKKVSADSKVVLKVKKRVVPKPTPTPTPKPTPTDPPKPSYTFTNMNTTKYAKSSVNVRDLPDKSGNKVGSLSGNQMVTVTGKCNETGWYRINYNNGEAYVADSFLVDEKIVVAPPVVDSSKSNNSNTTSKSTGSSEGITKSDPVPAAPAPAGTTYVVNTRSEKFHYPNCKSVKKMSDNNRWDCSLSRDELISKGYSPCGNCHP